VGGVRAEARGKGVTGYAVRALVDGKQVEADAEADTIELDIFDVIGDWWGEGVSAKGVLARLNAAKGAKKIVCRINSAGGDAFDGIAIGNLLSKHSAKVIVEVEALAASAASIIAMAGDEIRMSENALMMIHNTWTIAMGDARDMRHEADRLDKVNETLVVTYMNRTGRSREQVVAWMNDETWFTADEALELGFATHVVPAKQASAALRSDSCFASLRKPPPADKVAKAMGKRSSVEHQVVVNIDAKPILAELDQIRAALEDAYGLPRGSVVDPAPTPETSPARAPAAKAKEENNMSNAFAAIAAALGLPAGSPESDILTRASNLRENETQLVAVTGAESTAQIVGHVRGLKASADRAAGLQTELTEVRGERDKQNFAALMAKGQSAPVKLSPATAKLYQDRFDAAFAKGDATAVVADLEGFLAVAPTIMSAPTKQPANAGGGSKPSGETLVWNGKKYSELTYRQRAALAAENNELWRLMKAEFEGRAA
jgi:ATP-dependent protease ClpP protease subunit